MDRKSWFSIHLLGMACCVAMGLYFYDLSIFEVFSLPEWSGLLETSLLMLLWLFYGQICFEMGPLRGLSARWDAFLYGSLFGLWASAKRFRLQPHRLALSICGSFIGRTGIPVLLFFPKAYLMIPVGLIAGGLLSFKENPLPIEDDFTDTSLHNWLLGIGIFVWCVAWISPFWGLFIGCVLCVLKQNRFPAMRMIGTIWGVALYSTALLAGGGFLELCSRYMEGGGMGVQEGLVYDIFLLGSVFSLVADPITSAMTAQALWERALDVQRLPVVQQMFLPFCIGQTLFVWLYAGCSIKEKRSILILIGVSAVYVGLLEVL